MPDYPYSFTKLWKTASAQAARFAVLWPAIGNKGRRLSVPGGQLANIPGLLMLWRSRVSELHQHGLDWFVNKPVRIQYARNCLPAMAHATLPGTVNAGKMGRTCKLRDICPFCYGRWLAQIYRTAKKHLVDDDKLVYVHYCHLEKFGNFPTHGQLRELLWHYRTLVSRLATANTKASKGIYWTVALAPANTDPLGVVVHCGVLAIMPANEDFYLVPANWTIKTYSAPKTKETVRAVAKAFQYPTGILKGDPKMAVATISARKKLRLSDSSGCFRRKKP